MAVVRAERYPMPLSHVLEWDVATWCAALDLWKPYLAGLEDRRVLDIGARNGGLSLFFALCGMQVTCSDLRGPSPEARALHERHGVSEQVRYCALDTTALDLPDEEFDIVCFKSVLGGVGYGNRYDRQKQAITEMHRVLRPGGVLLFAENLRGSFLHRCFRQLFVPWARDWRYLAVPELTDLFSGFRSVRTSCHGFAATFGRTERQRSLLHKLDLLLDPVLPDSWKYMVAGVAEK